jgi:hypothetical protein
MKKEQKALAVIEGLCSYWEMEAFSDWGRAKELKDALLAKNKELLDKVQKMYRISHSALPTGCKHPDWEKETENEYRKLSESGMCWTGKEG